MRKCLSGDVFRRNGEIEKQFLLMCIGHRVLLISPRTEVPRGIAGLEKVGCDVGDVSGGIDTTDINSSLSALSLHCRSNNTFNAALLN